MAISLVTIGQKITAYIVNLIIAAVNQQGSTGVIPTSVAGTGVTVSSSGKVSFSAATSVSINGVFTSSYDSYEVEFVYTTTAAAATTVRLRASGTDSTGSVYDRQRLSGIATTASAASSLAQTSWGVAEAIIGRHQLRFTFENPAAAAITTGVGLVGSVANPMASTSGVSVVMVQHQTASAYDGITLTIASGSITGYARVRGINPQT